MTKAYSFFIFLLCMLLAHAESNKHQATGVTLELVSELSTIAPDESFTLGLKLDLDDDFHTYWKNPGIVGLPVSIDWTLPDGFTAGEIQWPVPERIKMSIHPAHGFKRNVTLLIPITSPADFPDSSAKFTAKVTWMACADGCYPGQEKLSLTLPVAKESKIDLNNKTIFAKAQNDIPKETPEWTYQAERHTQEKTISLIIKSSPFVEAPEELYFFSYNGLISSDQPQALEIDENGALTLTMTLSEYAPSNASELNGVLAWKTAGSTSLENFWLSCSLQ